MHKLVAVADDGHEMELSGLVSRFTCDYPAGEMGEITLHMNGDQVEHRTVNE
jgi:hypothetical protein